MSHVDDGMLHAYLDGGLSALDAVRVERHVTDCGACQVRLDQARALIQRAARLLEWASPPADRAAPPLAELRPAAAPRWQVPVAWAATIVIALGAGIYGGQALLRPGPREAEVAAAPAAQDRLAESPRAEPITALAVAESTTPAPEAAKAAAAPVERDSAPAAVVAAAVPRDTTTARNQAQVTGLAAATPAPDTTGRRVDSAAALAMAARLEQAAKSEPAPAAPTGAIVLGDSGRTVERRALTPAPAAGDVRGRAAEGFALAARPVSISIDSARALLGTAPVTIPDLPVTAIRGLDGTVTVEQVVPPGRLIRLVQRRAEADAAAAPEGLTRYVGGLRVEISGTMAADSLRMLLERAR